MAICLQRGPFRTEGIMESGGGAHKQGTLKNEWRAVRRGTSVCKGFHEGDLEEWLL